MDKTHQYIGFTSSGGILPKLIKFASAGDVNHVLIAYWSDLHYCWIEHGSVARGWIPQYAGRDEKPKITNLKYLYDVGDLRPGMAAVAEFVGAPYDYKGLLGMVWVEFAWHRLKKQVKNPLEADKAMFCSEIVRRIIRHSPRVVIDTMPKFTDGATDPEMIQAAIERAGFANLL